MHETRELDHDNILLYRFISHHRHDDAGIVAGVEARDLLDDTLEFQRAIKSG